MSTAEELQNQLELTQSELVDERAQRETLLSGMRQAVSAGLTEEFCKSQLGITE